MWQAAARRGSRRAGAMPDSRICTQASRLRSQPHANLSFNFPQVAAVSVWDALRGSSLNDVAASRLRGWPRHFSHLGTTPRPSLERPFRIRLLFVLFAWPLVCILLFVRLPVEEAAIWSLLAGYLLLPARQYRRPLLPPLDKFTFRR